MNIFPACKELTLDITVVRRFFCLFCFRYLQHSCVSSYIVLSCKVLAFWQSSRGDKL